MSTVRHQEDEAVWVSPLETRDHPGVDPVCTSDGRVGECHADPGVRSHGLGRGGRAASDESECPEAEKGRDGDSSAIGSHGRDGE